MRILLVFFSFFAIIHAQLFSQQTAIDLKKSPKTWEDQVNLSEKNIYQRTIKNELIRSEIMFVISMPFSYLLLTLLYGDGGSDRFTSFPTGYSFLTTEIAYYSKLAVTGDYGKKIIERPRYHKDVFNATEVYVAILSLFWSFTIAFNNIYESLIVKSLLQTRVYFTGQRVDFDLFTHYF